MNIKVKMTVATQSGKNSDLREAQRRMLSSIIMLAQICVADSALNLVLEPSSVLWLWYSSLSLPELILVLAFDSYTL